jgi:heme exporter protein D
MNWGSPAEFFAMGGHGLYVWGSYAVCALALLVEPILAARRHRQARSAEMDAAFDAADEVNSHDPR